MANAKSTFTFVYKKPENPSKTAEEVVRELIQSTIQKVVAK